MVSRANTICVGCIVWVIALVARPVLAEGLDPRPHLEWDRPSMVLVQRGGAYGRMARAGRAIVCCFERSRHACVRRSADEGRTWGPLIDVTGYAAGAAANPELLVCGEGRLLLFFNGRPRDGHSPFTIGMATSTDDGATWRADEHPLYMAGTGLSDGCYEPAAVQLPSGEIRMFFANEHGHAADHTQEIDQLRSHDGGATWSPPERVSHRPGGRDGMPVPILSADGRSILLAIEDNGLTNDHRLKPAIERLAIDGPTRSVGGDDDRRWGAVVDPPWPDRAYAGAPYLRQLLDGGPTVLACQPESGRPSAQRIRVYLGDATAHGFGRPTDPFPVDAGRNAQWNGLFVKSKSTVTAITTATIDGTSGVWAIDGHLQP